MTKKEYLDNYYYSYDDKTIMYLLKKYQLNIDIIKEYLSYMNIIDINKEYKSNKINNLKNIKIELLNNNLLYENKYFKEYIKEVENLLDKKSGEEKFIIIPTNLLPRLINIKFAFFQQYLY